MWLDALGRFVLEAYILVLLAGILVRLNTIPRGQLSKGAAHAGLQIWKILELCKLSLGKWSAWYWNLVMMELGLNKSLRVYREGKVDHIRRMTVTEGSGCSV